MLRNVGSVASPEMKTSDTSTPSYRGDSSKYNKLLRDLEGDSVDTEILDEELRFLKEREPKTCRGRTAQVLESGSPSLHVVVCVLILLDAGIVLTQIIMDVHTMRCKYHSLSDDLTEIMKYLNSNHAADPNLIGFDGFNLTSLLSRIRSSPGAENSTSSFNDSASHVHPVQQRHRRDSSMTLESLGTTDHMRSDDEVTHRTPPSMKEVTRIHCNIEVSSGKRIDQSLCDKLNKTLSSGFHDVEAKVSCISMSGRFSSNVKFERSQVTNDESILKSLYPQLRKTISRRSASAGPSKRLPGSWFEALNNQLRRYRSRKPRNADGETFLNTNNIGRLLVDDALLVDVVEHRHGSNGETGKNSDNWSTPIFVDDELDHDTEAHRGLRCKFAGEMQKISHLLHFCSVGILGLFVLQVVLKIYAMGTDFFTKKIEIFDGAITAGSFMFDVVLMEGVSVVEGDETLALIVVFLLWRVLRLANSVVVASKQRQDFRISLQKRARQRAEKRSEWLGTEIDWREREIDKLAALCAEKGASEEEIAHCRVKHTFRRMNASEGLSSVASFSLGLSMSMRGAAISNSSDEVTTASGSNNSGTNGSTGAQPPVPNISSLHPSSQPLPAYVHPALLRCLRPPGPPRKPSFQDLFPVVPHVNPSAGSSSGFSLLGSRRRSSVAGVIPVSRIRRSSCAAAVELIHRRRPSTLFGGGGGGDGGVGSGASDDNSGGIEHVHGELISRKSGSGFGLFPTAWNLIGGGRRHRRLSTIEESARLNSSGVEQLLAATMSSHGDNYGDNAMLTHTPSVGIVLPVVIEESESPIKSTLTPEQIDNSCRSKDVVSENVGVSENNTSEDRPVRVSAALSTVEPMRSVDLDLLRVQTDNQMTAPPSSDVARSVNNGSSRWSQKVDSSASAIRVKPMYQSSSMSCLFSSTSVNQVPERSSSKLSTACESDAAILQSSGLFVELVDGGKRVRSSSFIGYTNKPVPEPSTGCVQRSLNKNWSATNFSREEHSPATTGCDSRISVAINNYTRFNDRSLNLDPTAQTSEETAVLLPISLRKSLASTPMDKSCAETQANQGGDLSAEDDANILAPSRSKIAIPEIRFQPLLVSASSTESSTTTTIAMLSSSRRSHSLDSSSFRSRLELLGNLVDSVSSTAVAVGTASAISDAGLTQSDY